MAYLMTVDAGTGSVRAVIFDEQGREVSIGQREWEHLVEDALPNSASPSFLNLSLDATQCNKASMFRSLEENAAWELASIEISVK